MSIDLSKEISVEIRNYREANKGALKAYFTLVIKPLGLTIYDCRFFANNDNMWFNYPQKEVKKEDKTEYFSLVSYADKEMKYAMDKLVIDKLKGFNEKNRQNIPSRAPDKVQSKPSINFEEMPF